MIKGTDHEFWKRIFDPTWVYTMFFIWDIQQNMCDWPLPSTYYLILMFSLIISITNYLLKAVKSIDFYLVKLKKNT